MARIMTAVFNPTSFLDYIAPLQMYGEEYKKNEAAIAELEGYAANLALRAAKEPNEEWAKKYLLYADSLQRLAENMSSRGLSATLRSDLLNIRRSYFRDIVPIQEAVNTQLKLAELRNAQNIAHPEYRTEWTDIPSVSALLETPTLGLTSYSGAAVEKSALEAAASAAMRHGIKDTFEPYRQYWMQTVSERGFTEKEMQLFKAAIAQNPQALGVLEDIFRQVKSQYNNFKGMSPALINKLEAEIISGIFKGAAYNKNVKYSENTPALKALEHSYRMREILKQLLPSNPPYSPTSLRGNPYALASILGGLNPQEIRSYEKYFVKDKTGKIIGINKAGWKEYFRTIPIDLAHSQFGINLHTTASSTHFRLFMDKLNGGKPISTNREKGAGSWTHKKFADLYNSLIYNGNRDADTLINTAYSIALANLDNVKLVVIGARGLLGGSRVPVLKYTTKGFVNDGYIDLTDKDFEKAIYSGSVSSLGNHIIISAKGKDYYIPLRAIHPALNATIELSIGTNRNSGIKSYLYKNGRPLTEEELDEPIYLYGVPTTRRDEINKEINAALNNFTSAFELSKVEDHTTRGGLH